MYVCTLIIVDLLIYLSTDLLTYSMIAFDISSTCQSWVDFEAGTRLFMLAR